jgi:hypothetical protein
MDVNRRVLVYDNQVELSCCLAFSLIPYVSKQTAVKRTRPVALETVRAVHSSSVQDK